MAIRDEVIKKERKTERNICESLRKVRNCIWKGRKEGKGKL
jgi:hypothetical protein